MYGVLINSSFIIIGSLIGMYFSKLLKDSYKNTLMHVVGLSVVVIGVNGAIKADNIILTIVSLVVGSLVGEALRLDKHLDKFGNYLELRFRKSNLAFGFTSASILFCVGAMAIVGSIEAGILKSYETLTAKAILDGITSIILASTLGFGVLLSSVSVFIYQGLIVLFSSSVSHILSDYVINQLLVVGSILIIGLGLNILELKEMKIINMLPSIVIVLFIAFLV